MGAGGRIDDFRPCRRCASHRQVEGERDVECERTDEMTTPRLPTEVTVDQDPELVPDCPFCSVALTAIRARELPAVGKATFRFGKRFAYACPNCGKLLGITHRKGFWMG